MRVEVVVHVVVVVLLGEFIAAADYRSLYTHEFAVELHDGGQDVADLVATINGFQHIRKVLYINLLRCDQKRNNS